MADFSAITGQKQNKSKAESELYEAFRFSLLFVFSMEYFFEVLN